MIDARVINEVIQCLEPPVGESSTRILINTGRAAPINREFFYQNFVKTGFETVKIAFVDGGNAEIIRAPNFSVQYVRLFGSVFRNNVRIHREQREFYVLARAVKKENGVVYELKTFDADFNIQNEFDGDDATLRVGKHTVSVSRAGEMGRVFAELELAKRMMSMLNTGDILVRDGTLLDAVSGEKGFFDALFAQAVSKGVCACGFSKTTTLMTDMGNSAATVLSMLSPRRSWYYTANESDSVKICFARLHDASRHVFRVDLFNARDVSKVFSILASNAQDGCFLGYPYGLIDADKNACITKQESELIRVQWMALLGERFDAGLNALNAHDVLNELH